MRRLIENSRAQFSFFRPTKFCLFILLFFGPVTAVFSSSILPVDSIRPGMRGFGLSVFSGTTIDTFEIEVIDVIHKAMPRGDRILCRLSGAGLEKSGVIAGMSGSPVYIEGKLVGAVAYAWGWSKEPIGGVTPIQEMLDIWDTKLSSGSPTRTTSWELPQLPIPLAISGLTPELERLLVPTLEACGMKPVAGSSVSTYSDTSTFVPGGIVSVTLIDGDVGVAAVGTITHREGNKILAFGHPFFLGGDVQLPMGGGVIHSVLPSFATSFKIFSPGPTIGTITQDRATGIAGVIGMPPPMIPVQVVVNSSHTKNSYNFRVVRQKQLTPEFLPVGIAEVVLQTEGIFEEATLSSVLQLYFPDRVAAQIHHTIAETNPVQTLFEKTRSELNLLFTKNIEPTPLESVKVKITIKPERHKVKLIAAFTERNWAHPGETVNIQIELQDYRGAETTETVKVAIPSTAPPGIVNITVSSANEFFTRDVQRLPGAENPKSLSQLLKILEQSGREDELIVAGFITQPGFSIGDREMPRPPPSIQSVFSHTQKVV
ncbi:MAG: SpoIVB peptidase S55 domain-containing protein, partial [bacterium]